MMTLENQLIERGVRRGFLLCAHEMLLRLLRRKFNTVPLYYQKQLEQADQVKLYRWSENLLEAKTLEEVFG